MRRHEHPLFHLLSQQQKIEALRLDHLDQANEGLLKIAKRALEHLPGLPPSYAQNPAYIQLTAFVVNMLFKETLPGVAHQGFARELAEVQMKNLMMVHGLSPAEIKAMIKELAKYADSFKPDMMH